MSYVVGQGRRLNMGQATWSWIVPDGLWEIAKPLLPPSKVRPQGRGTQDTPDETLFAAIIYVLVSGCAWRALPPCFGISKSTAHRRFVIWSRAGVWGRLHEEILHSLGDADLLDLSRAVPPARAGARRCRSSRPERLSRLVRPGEEAEGQVLRNHAVLRCARE
jgi:transposase